MKTCTYLPIYLVVFEVTRIFRSGPDFPERSIVTSQIDTLVALKPGVLDLIMVCNDASCLRSSLWPSRSFSTDLRHQNRLRNSTGSCPDRDRLDLRSAPPNSSPAVAPSTNRTEPVINLFPRISHHLAPARHIATSFNRLQKLPTLDTSFT